MLFSNLTDAKSLALTFRQRGTKGDHMETRSCNEKTTLTGQGIQEIWQISLHHTKCTERFITTYTDATAICGAEPEQSLACLVATLNKIG